MARHHPKDRRWADRRRIDVLDERERLFWAKFFGVEIDQLVAAVDKVGTAAEDVRQQLQREHPGWIVYAGRTQRRYDPPSGHIVL